jgi:hypothetical protein
MPREFQQAGDVAFAGFNSFTNSSAFDPAKGMLEYAQNVRNVEGVITRRAGIAKASPATGFTPVFSAHSGHPAGDAIYMWNSAGVVKKWTPVTNLVTDVTPVARAFRPVRGQGYLEPATIEASKATYWDGESDFEASAFCLGRIAYAKNDQIWLSLFGGVQPFNGETLSLVQETFDPVRALHYSYASRKLFAFGNRSVYMIELAVLPSMSLENGQPEQSHFHRVSRISSMDGILAKNSVAEVMGQVFWLGHGGIHMADADKGMLDGVAPISLPIQDLFDGIPAAEMQKAVGMAYDGRYYLLLPNKTDYKLNRILIVDPTIEGKFESYDDYGTKEFVSICAIRNSAGVLRPYAVGKDGFIYQLEVGTTDDSQSYLSVIRTRNYNLGTEMDKRYDAVLVRLDTAGQAEVDINFKSINPEGTHLLDTFNASLGSTVRRALAGKKCAGCNVEVVVKSGFPLIYSVMVDGSIAGRSIFNVF